MSYLYDLDDVFVGIGLLLGFNPEKNYLKILTPYTKQIKRILVGSILLSIEGEEVYTNIRSLVQEP